MFKFLLRWIKKCTSCKKYRLKKSYYMNKGRTFHYCKGCWNNRMKVYARAVRKHRPIFHKAKIK